MPIRILIWILIIGLGIGALYAFESARVPCRTALVYSIGRFDERFGLTRSEFQAALAQAEKPWEDALGRDLFHYDPGAIFPVNLIFDERQQRTIDGRKLETALETVQTKQATIKERYDANAAALAKSRNEYDTRVAAFDQAVARYNARVADWNRSDRSDEDELEGLQAEEGRLNREARDLEALRDKVNALVAEVNRYAKEEEKVVERYNVDLETFTEIYGTGEAFDQGMYEGTSIDIYQFDDRDHLRMVLIHEFGHALGLGHVDNARSIMYPVMGSQDIGDLRLSDEDRAALGNACSLTAWELLERDMRAIWTQLSA